jgi:hypothetical protein
MQEAEEAVRDFKRGSEPSWDNFIRLSFASQVSVRWGNM